MIVKFGALSPLGWLGWSIVALIWVWLARSIRRGPFVEAHPAGGTRPENQAGTDIFADLRARYARGEVGPDEYPSELARVPGAIGLYNPFKKR